jgi:O-antigen/teichoic acid export membrane protein
MIKNILLLNRIPKPLSDAILYSLSAALLGAINFILLPVLSRSLGESGYGYFSIITSFGAISSAIFFLGMTSAVQRFYYKFDTQNQRESIYRAGFAITVAGSFLQIIAAFLLSNPIGSIIFSGKNHLGISLFFGLAYSSAQLVTNYVAIRYRINRDPLGALSFSFSLLVLNVVSLFVVSIFGDLRSINWVFVALLLSCLVHLAFYRHLWCGRYTLPFTSTDTLKDLLAYGIVSVFASGAAQVFFASDLIIASRLLNPASVGQLASVIKVSAIYSMLFVSPVSQVFPYFVFSKEGRHDLPSRVNSALIGFLGISLSAIVLSSLFLSKLLPYVTTFQFSNNVLMAIYFSLFIAVCNGVANFSSVGLTLGFRVDLLAWAYVASALVKFYLFSWLSPSAGLPGFLAFVGIASLFLNAILFLISSPYLSYKPFLSRSLYFCLQVFSAALGFCLLSSNLPFMMFIPSYVLIFVSFLLPLLVPSLRRPLFSLFS